jgi:hypothetical protein
MAMSLEVPNPTYHLTRSCPPTAIRPTYFPPKPMTELQVMELAARILQKTSTVRIDPETEELELFILAHPLDLKTHLSTRGYSDAALDEALGLAETLAAADGDADSFDQVVDVLKTKQQQNLQKLIAELVAEPEEETDQSRLETFFLEHSPSELKTYIASNRPGAEALMGALKFATTLAEFEAEDNKPAKFTEVAKIFQLAVSPR